MLESIFSSLRTPLNTELVPAEMPSVALERNLPRVTSASAGVSKIISDWETRADRKRDYTWDMKFQETLVFISERPDYEQQVWHYETISVLKKRTLAKTMKYILWERGTTNPEEIELRRTKLSARTSLNLRAYHILHPYADFLPIPVMRNGEKVGIQFTNDAVLIQKFIDTISDYLDMWEAKMAEARKAAARFLTAGD